MKRSRDELLQEVYADHIAQHTLRKAQLNELFELEKLVSRDDTQKARLSVLKMEIEDSRQLLAVQSQIISHNAAPASEADQVFSKTDKSFITKVTGVNAEWRKWNVKEEIEVKAEPSATFKSTFELNKAAFSMYNETGRRTVIDMFLRDVVGREEFKQLQVFTEYEISLKAVDERSQLLCLSGKADYTVGHSCADIFDKGPPKESHLIAVEGKRDGLEENYWQCVAQTAALHKARKDAGKARCSAWGILTNATAWRFLFINETGVLSTSEDFALDLREYNQAQVLAIYQCIYHIVGCCFKASPPPSPEKERARTGK